MGDQPHSFRASIIDLVSARTRKAQQKAAAKQANKSTPANKTGANFSNKSASKKTTGANAAASNTKLQMARGIQIIVLIVAVVYFMKSCDLF